MSNDRHNNWNLFYVYYRVYYLSQKQVAITSITNLTFFGIDRDINKLIGEMLN